MSCTFGRTCILGLAGLVVGLGVVFDIFYDFLHFKKGYGTLVVICCRLNVDVKYNNPRL